MGSETIERHRRSPGTCSPPSLSVHDQRSWVTTQFDHWHDLQIGGQDVLHGRGLNSEFSEPGVRAAQNVVPLERFHLIAG